VSPNRQERVRIGVINLMPRAEAYAELLRNVLGEAELVFIRLRSHVYTSSEQGALESSHVYFEQAEAEAPLDGLILTGAPVEELPFEEVHYWSELREILLHARQTISSTLGLCWGGMALAQLLGVGKVRFRSKLFGSFPLIALSASPLMPPGEPLWYAQSRHAGVHVGTLESAVRNGEVRVLAYSEHFGYTVFESSDGRYLMHLGHPEYTPERLVAEYRRDQALERSDVGAPHGVDLEQPERGYRSHGPLFFAHWLQQLQLARQRA
jgi:homoserine O-succinyltransferase/O-acetyltransferase